MIPYLMVMLDWMCGTLPALPPRAVAFSRTSRKVLLSDDQVLNVEMFFGVGWQEPFYREGAISCVAGPDEQGRWYSINLAHFRPQTVH